MKINATKLALLTGIALGLPAVSAAQEAPAAPEQAAPTSDFDAAKARVQKQLEEAVLELNELRDTMADEKVPLTRELNRLETELMEVRQEYQTASRELTKQTLDLTNLRSEIKARRDETSYLSGLIAAYINNFKSTLHVVEDDRYAAALEAAELAPDNSNLSEEEIFGLQAELFDVSLERLHELLGGTRFEGTALDSNSLVKNGTFVLVGPAALFLSEDGQEVGSAEMPLNISEPTTIGFTDLEDQEAAKTLVSTGAGLFPLDPTLGDAHKIAATEETFLEHVKKGGPVMVPIFAMAGLALLIALLKWMGMLFLRKPSKKQLAALMQAVGAGDEPAAQKAAAAMKGPGGKMLAAGVAHLNEPRELIEEVMYETVLTAKLRVQRFLPFIAICAASAPLLGLLGTVTGIINTFKMITVYGSGDVKSLSGGISEALITTKFGLIVAIPSLLLHAFLSRKGRGIIGKMEQAAVAFANQVSRSTFGKASAESLAPAERELAVAAPITTTTAVATGQGPDRELVRIQVKEVLSDLLDNLDDRMAQRLAAARDKPVDIPKPADVPAPVNGD